MPTVRLTCASALSGDFTLIIGLSLLGCPGPLYTDTSQCSLYRLQTFSSHHTLLTIPSHNLKSTYFAPTCQLVVVVCPRRHKQQPLSPLQGPLSPIHNAFRSCVLLQRRILNPCPPCTAQHYDLSDRQPDLCTFPRPRLVRHQSLTRFQRHRLDSSARPRPLERSLHRP